MKNKLLISLSLAVTVISVNMGGVLPVRAAESIVIADNKDSNVSYSGSRTDSTTLSGYYGDDYACVSGGGAVVMPEVKTNGYYKIYFRWPRISDGGEIEISVTDSAGQTYYNILDQTMNGGYWVFAGTYFIQKDKKAEIKISSADNKEFIFDAVRMELSAESTVKAKSSWFENSDFKYKDDSIGIVNTQSGNVFSQRNRYSFLTRLTSVFGNRGKESGGTEVKSAETMTEVGDEIIYDDSSEGSAVSGGNWKKQVDPEAYNGSYMADGSMDVNFTQYAKWKPSITTDGKYELYMRWPAGENRPSEAKISIKNSSNVIGKATVDQSKNANQWNLIGEYNMYAGTPYAVLIGANSYGITAADAIKLRLVSKDVPPEETEYSIFERKDYTSNKQDKYNIVLDDSNKFYFTKNGEVFNINGACYSSVGKYMEEGMEYFTAAGGNMLRTYNLEPLKAGLLDYAYERGVGVMAGIGIPKTASTYADESEYRAYVEEQKKTIDTFKNHPALVMWSVNNESEGADVDGEIYAMMEEIAEYIKSVDPYHPIATAFAGCNPDRQKKLKSLAPAIDILGMNAYSGINSVYPTSVEAGWNAPVMVTEYGPNGTWGNECTRTTWNVVIEQNNDEKANLYRERHLNAVMNNNKGIGGFAFCLPYAVGTEGTLTWYAFVYNGMRTPVMDEMQYAWTGKYPDNVAPRIKSFTVNGKEASDSVTVFPGEELVLKVSASDKNGDELTYNFEIREEVQANFTGKYPDVISAADNPQNKSELTMEAPSAPGYYRIYASASDGHNNTDAVNVPIYVQQTAQVSSGDKEKAEKLLAEAAAMYSESGKISAEVSVRADDNLNGMPYTGSGHAVMESDGEILHITSDVTYQTDGREMTEAYISGGKNYILNSDNVFKEITGNDYYNVMSAFDKIVNDKNILNEFTVDTDADENYTILTGNVFIPEFYPLALSGIDSVSFLTEKDNPDAYSLVIYISKKNGRIEKIVASAGYVRSVEKAEYRKLQYTYMYDYGGSFTITMPDYGG